MALHNDFGKDAELQAVIYLKEHQYQILETNYIYQHAEIDIIALKDNTLVVVEVKARASTHYGQPETFVNAQKIKLLVKAINQYIERNNLSYEVRFDIISIVKNPYQNTITHIIDAFYPF